MNIFRLFTRRIIVAYLVGLTVILLASSLVLMIGLAQITSASYTVNQEPLPLLTAPSLLSGTSVIVDKSASAIFASRVPTTIADALNSLSSSAQAFPMTVSLVEANRNTPLVVRGMPQSAIQSISILSRFSPLLNSSNASILLGTDIASELSARVGSPITLSSPQVSGKIFNATVAGIFSSGSESDYEGVVPLYFGQELGNDAPGFASAIVIPSSAMPFKVSANYETTINYTGYPGTISVTDSSGYEHYSILVGNASGAPVHDQVSVVLPFGLYNIALESSGLKTSLKEFATVSNGTIINLSTSSLSPARNFVSILSNNSSVKPSLTSNDNESIAPSYYDAQGASWVFVVESGRYLLSYENTTFPILVFGNATFSPGVTQALDSDLKVQVTQEASSTSFSTASSGSYTITVEDNATSQILFAETTSNSSLSIPVESGHTYLVRLLTSGSEVSLEQSVTIPSSGGTTALAFLLPNIPLVPEIAPVASYSSIGLGLPTQSALFHYLEAGAVVSTLSLFAIVFGLLVVTVFILGAEFLGSLRMEIKALAATFPESAAVTMIVKLPLLALSLGAALFALFLSLGLFDLFQMSKTVIFAGYGLATYPLTYVALLVFSLALISSMWSFVSFNRMMKS